MRDKWKHYNKIIENLFKHKKIVKELIKKIYN
jgi:hypothetical protein